MQSKPYQETIKLALDALGISADLMAQIKLPLQREARALVVAEIDRNGNKHLLVQNAATAWFTLKNAASQDNVILEIVSAFRSIDEQSAIIRTRLNQGWPIASILTLSAPPGYSEHHTGCAIDINTPGCPAREEPFADTAAFRWLMVHAPRFGYTLSYPRDNSLGFIYEPWHWLFRSSIDSN